jgi:hypothetical protein
MLQTRPHPNHPHPDVGEDERKRETTWRAATGEVIATAMQRYVELAQLMGLGPMAAPAFVSAAMEATRQYQTGYMYANYERRTGHPYPDEGLANEEEAWAAAWRSEVSRLKTLLEAEQR